MELDATWGRSIRIWWGFLWRYALSTVIVLIFGLPVAILMGTLLGLSSVSPETASTIGSVVGAIAVLFCPLLAIKMLLNRNYGEFRLAIVKNKNKDVA